MPTYDYRCERTGEMFEKWQSFADDALTVCPEIHAGEKKACGAPVKKVFSKVGISFKGDGFYKNDHGDRKSKGSAEAKDSSESSSGSAPAADSSTKDSPTKDSSPSANAAKPKSSPGTTD